MQQAVLRELILVDACGLPEYEAYLGRTVREIAADFGVHVADAFMDLNLQTGLAADFATGQAPVRTRKLGRFSIIQQLWPGPLTVVRT